MQELLDLLKEHSPRYDLNPELWTLSEDAATWVVLYNHYQAMRWDMGPHPCVYPKVNQLVLTVIGVAWRLDFKRRRGA